MQRAMATTRHGSHHHRQVADDINARFLRGEPSNVPDEAGVLIHVWDMLESPAAPWQPCLHEGCKKGPRGMLERLPSSLIYRNMPNLGKNDSVPMFADGLRGGLILRPSPSQVRCVYPSDGHSRWNADGCSCPFPGDVQKGLRRADDCSRWCEDPRKAADHLVAAVIGSAGRAKVREVHKWHVGGRQRRGH